MNHAKAAEFLRAARRGKSSISAIADELRPASQDDAYRIQNAIVAGDRVIGYKAAATNEAAQTLLKVAAPFFGRLLERTTQRSPARLSAANFAVRCIEPEFGFLIGRDVPPGEYDRESIAPFVEAVIPAMEVVDHRFADWTAIGAPSLIADNAIHGAWIEGEPIRDWRTVDLAAQPVAMILNGEAIRSGSGAAVLGHPLNVVAWLANELPRHGRRLQAGDKITTGTATPVYFASAGDSITADFGYFGRVELVFDA
jgi:2-keto-4-pentenoate hydratase